MPGQRVADAILEAYLAQNPAINWERNEKLQIQQIDIIDAEPPAVAQEPPQGGHPYRGGPPPPVRPKSPWRAAWAWLKALLR